MRQGVAVDVWVIRNLDGALMLDLRSGKLRTYKSEEQANKYAARFCGDGKYTLERECVLRS